MPVIEKYDVVLVDDAVYLSQWEALMHMVALRRWAAFILVATFITQGPTAIGQSAKELASTATPPAPRNGQHDFDFEIGTWKTHLRRLQHPLTGSTTWVEYDGTTTVRSLWKGRANLVELDVDGRQGHIEALSLRLYNPETHQWSLNFANSTSGTLGTPSVGGIKDGCGEFFDQEALGSRMILVRFIITLISATEVHFEQAFSDDGGKTWEVNWIAVDTRVS